MECDEGMDRSDAHEVNKSQRGHHNQEHPFDDGLEARICHPQHEEDSGAREACRSKKQVEEWIPRHREENDGPKRGIIALTRCVQDSIEEPTA